MRWFRIDIIAIHTGTMTHHARRVVLHAYTQMGTVKERNTPQEHLFRLIGGQNTLTYYGTPASS